MANLEIVRATASTTQAVLTEAFSVNVTVKNTTSKAIGVAYLIFTIDGSTATALRSDFSIGASKTITVTATFDGSTHPSAWTTAMQSRRSAALYVAASDNGTTTSDAVEVESFNFLDAYYTPKIEKFIVERTADEANTVKATIKLSHADGLTTTQINRLSCTLSDWDGTEYRTLTLHRTMTELYTGVTDDTAVITDTFDTGKDHTLTLVFGDTAEVVQQIDTVEHAFANLHLSGASTGGACYGGFCKATENNPMLESYYPAYFYNGIAYGGINYPLEGTGEQDTGVKWVDGKTIYRQAIKFTSFTKGSYVYKNISSRGTIDTVVAMYGTAKYAGGQYPVPSTAAEAYMICVYAYGNPATQIGLFEGKSLTLTQAWVIVEYTLSDE